MNGLVRRVNLGARWKGFLVEEETEKFSLSSKETARFGDERLLVEIDGLVEKECVDALTTR